MNNFSLKQKPIIYLLIMLACMVAYSFAMSDLVPMLGMQSELDQMLFKKWLFVAGLVGFVIFRGLTQASGLKLIANWRTLPLYWPMALVLGLIMAGAAASPSGFSMPAIEVTSKLLVLCIAVGIGEELIFRGLVLHWFRDLPLRSKILISAGSFAAIHLTGLASDIPSVVILSQVYLAFSFGLIFACARARDVSILIPIGVHALFDFVAFLPKGGVSETFNAENVEQVVGGMLFAGTIALLWGLFLLWKSNPETVADSAEHGSRIKPS